MSFTLFAFLTVQFINALIPCHCKWFSRVSINVLIKSFQEFYFQNLKCFKSALSQFTPLQLVLEHVAFQEPSGLKNKIRWPALQFMKDRAQPCLHFLMLQTSSRGKNKIRIHNQSIDFVIQRCIASVNQNTHKEKC